MFKNVTLQYRSESYENMGQNLTAKLAFIWVSLVTWDKNRNISPIEGLEKKNHPQSEKGSENFVERKRRTPTKDACLVGFGAENTKIKRCNLIYSKYVLKVRFLSILFRSSQYSEI